MSAESDQASAPLVGTVLEGAYRLTRLIGQGGMGTVYEAQQIRLGRRVAVKLMARDLASNQEALARFRREAEITSQIGHPHIVQVFDFGSATTGEPYLVMEFLEGEDLDHRIRHRGRLPLTAAVDIVKQVASALAATHAKGVVHRDLKPANVFLVRLEGGADFVKVLDFGISKVRSATTKLTRASVVMGSPNYMAPEQARGRIDQIDHGTDQWSLGCIAYEALAGRAPFVADDVAALLYLVIHEEPPPLADKAPGVPAQVEAVLRKALSKSQADRYPTIAAFSRALEIAVAPSAATAGAPETSAAHWDDGRTIAAPSAFTQLREAQPTTFSRTAGEIAAGSTKVDHRRRRIGLALGGGAIALGTIVALVARLGGSGGGSGGPRPATSVSVPAPAASAASPRPVDEPPLPGRPEISALPAPTPSPAAKKVKPSAAEGAEASKTGAPKVKRPKKALIEEL